MSIFEKKKQVPVKELIGKAVKTPAKIPGTGQIYPRQELIKMLKTLLPYQKIGSYLQDWEAKKILRSLRKEEERVKSVNAKKWLELNRLRRFLEEDWGLKGKY